MPKSQGFHESAHSNSPPDLANRCAAVVPANTPPTKSAETLSEPRPCSDQIKIFERQLAELEQEKTDLIQSASDANQRAAEAEKRVAAAEAETTAAKQRAQDRYTEKLHANNEVRHLRQALEERDFRRRDYMIKVEKCLGSLKARIMQLEIENSTKNTSKESDEKIKTLEEQLDDMSAGFVASQEEKASIKEQSDKLIQTLQDLATKQQASLAKEKQEHKSTKDAMEKLQAKIQDNEAKFKAREKELMQSNETKLQDAKSKWQSKLKSTQNRVKELEKEAERARQQAEQAKQQAEQARQQAGQARQQAEHAKLQTEHARQQAESARQQLQMAILTIRNNAQPFGIQQQHQFNSSNQALNSNKKRKLSSNDHVNFNTNEVQPARTQTFVPGSTNTMQMNPRDSNSVTPTMGAPSNAANFLIMAQNDNNRPYVPQRSNVPAGSSTPIQPFQQQHYPVNGVSPISQGMMPTQNMRPMVPQQSPSHLPAQKRPNILQNPGFNIARPLPQNYVQKPQDLPLAVNTGIGGQPLPDFELPSFDFFQSGATPQVNNMNGAFPASMNGAGMPSPFNFDSSLAGLSTPMPGSEDLFSNNAWMFAGDLGDVNAQGPTQDGGLNAGVNGNPA